MTTGNANPPPWRRMLLNRFVAVLGTIAIVTLGWNIHV